MNKPTKRICGAKNRQGNPCQVPPMLGKDRCRLHGGKTPKGKTGGAKNGNHSSGLYAKYLTDDEQAQWTAIPLGQVDDEIRMCRVWLARCLELEAKIGKAPHKLENLAGIELAEIKRSSGDAGTSTHVTSRRPDVMARANMLLGRIAQLEKVRTELLTAATAAKADTGVRYVVEIPAEEMATDWLKNYADKKGE